MEELLLEYFTYRVDGAVRKYLHSARLVLPTHTASLPPQSRTLQPRSPQSRTLQRHSHTFIDIMPTPDNSLYPPFPLTLVLVRYLVCTPTLHSYTPLHKHTPVSHTSADSVRTSPCSLFKLHHECCVLGGRRSCMRLSCDCV